MFLYFSAKLPLSHSIGEEVAILDILKNCWLCRFYSLHLIKPQRSVWFWKRLAVRFKYVSYIAFLYNTLAHRAFNSLNVFLLFLVVWHVFNIFLSKLKRYFVISFEFIFLEHKVLFVDPDMFMAKMFLFTDMF